MSQNKYGQTPIRTDACVESKKDLRERLVVEKLKLKDFIELSRYMDVPWEARYQTIGQQYLTIADIKKELKRMKNVKK